MPQVEYLGEDIQGIKPFQPKVEFLGTDYQPQVEFLGEQIPTETPVTETPPAIPTQEIPTQVVEPSPVSARDVLNLKGVSTLVPPEKIVPPEYTGEPIIRTPQPLEQFLSRPLTPEESKNLSFKKEVSLRPTTVETLGEAFTGGIFPVSIDPVLREKHPIASFAGWIIGLAGAGKATEPIKYIGSLLTRFPALKPVVEQIVHGGATFTVKDLADQVAEQTGQGKEVSIDTARLLVNTAIGAGFAIPTIPKAVTDSLWYRKLAIKERGLVSLTADELRAKGYSEGDIARVNPQFFKQAFEERLKSEIPPEQVAQEFKGSLDTMYQARRSQYEREGKTPEEASMMAWKDTSGTIEGQNQTRTILENTIRKQTEESYKLQQAEEADRLKQAEEAEKLRQKETEKPVVLIEPSLLSAFPEMGEEAGGGININTFAPYEIKSLEDAGAIYTNESGQRVADINKLWEARKELQKLPIKEQNRLYEESKAKLFKEPEVEFLGTTEEVLKEQPKIEPQAPTEVKPIEPIPEVKPEEIKVEIPEGKPSESVIIEPVTPKKGAGEPTSKIPDMPEGGKVVYHGTWQPLDEIKEVKGGFFATTTSKFAEEYTNLRASQKGLIKTKSRTEEGLLKAFETLHGKNKKVHELVINLKKPLDLRQSDTLPITGGYSGTGQLYKLFGVSEDKFIQAAKDAYPNLNINDVPSAEGALNVQVQFDGRPMSIAQFLGEMKYEGITPRIKKFIQDLGYDGVIFNDVVKENEFGTDIGKSETFVAFNKNQIKFNEPIRSPKEGEQPNPTEEPFLKPTEEAETRKAETTGTLPLTWEDLGISKRDATLYEQKGLTPEEIAGGEEILKKPLEMPKMPITINFDTILKEGRTSITKDELNRLYDVKSGRVSKQDMVRVLQEKGITVEKGRKPKPQEVEKIEVSNQKTEAHEKSKGFLEDEQGFVNLTAVVDGIKKINPFEANKAELAELKIKEVKDILIGEKSKIGKLWSIPYHVGRKWKEFKPVFDHVQDSMYEFNELIYNVNEKLPDNIRDKIRGNDKVAETIYSGQEEKTPHWYVRKSGWEKLGLTEEEIKNFDIIKEEIPQTEGAMQTRPETLLEHGYTEKQILHYLKVRKAISDWKQNKEELLDMGLTEGEIFSRKGTGKTLNESELRAKGLNDEEIGLYNKGRETIDYVSNYLIEKKKHLYGYYDADTSPIEKAMLDLMINQQVKRYGGYIPLMRFGDHWLSYLNPATGEKTVVSFESQLESIKARNDLSKEGITVTEIDMKDAKQRKQMYPYMSLSQLDSLIESAGIEGRLSDIKDLRDVIKERMGDVRFIQREWVPGYFRTGENVVKTIEAYADQTLSQYTRGKAKYEAQKVIDGIDNLNLKQYSQDYIDTYMSYDKDYFNKARNLAYLFYLGLKPSFAFMNLTQPIMTLLPRLHADVGFLKGSRIFAESQEKFVEYIVHRTAQLAGKSIKTRLDKDLLDALEKARKQEIISAQWIQEVLGTKEGVKTLEGGKAVKQVASNLLGIVGTSTEKVNRIVSFIAGWDIAKAKGLSNKQAFEMGKDYVASTQFIYGRQNIPVALNKIDQRLKGLAKSSFLFQSWGLNYIHNLNYFLRGALSGTEKVQNLKGLMSTLTILGGMTGLRGIPLILLLGSIYTLVTGNSPDEKFREALGKKHTELADYLLYGTVSKTTGINVSSLVGLGDYPSLKPAMLGIGERYKRASQFYNQDRYWKMIAEMSPDMIRNYLHGKKMEEEGTARVLSTGEKLTLGGEPIEITPYEAQMKKLGFTPLKVAKAQEERFAENLLSNKLKNLTSEYTTKMADAIIDEDDEKLSKIEREIELKNKELPFEITIDRKALKEKINQLEQGRSIKKFPKRIRPEIQERRELYK